MKHFIIILLLTLFSISYSQVTQQWVARYSGQGTSLDKATSLVPDGLGNVYVTGSTTYLGILTIKYNSQGDTIWTRTYKYLQNNAYDIGTAITIDMLGAVYVTGISKSGGLNYDIVTIKYDSSGVQQWVARYNGPSNNVDEAYSIKVDNFGFVYVTGFSVGSGTQADFITIKYSNIGSLIWAVTYNGPGNGNDSASSIALDGSNVYVTGRSYGGASGIDYTTIKYDANGEQKWVARYNGPGNGYDEARALGIDNSGYIYVTGRSLGSGTNLDIATIKYSSDGTQLLVDRYNGTGNGVDEARDLKVDAAGFIYITGRGLQTGTGYDYVTIKYNSSLVQQWVAKYSNTNSDDWAYSLAVDMFGNVYVTGRSLGSNWDYATVRYSSSGVQQWVARYDGPGSFTDYPYSIAVDANGSVFVTGESYGSGTNEDYATIKYTQQIGVKKISSEIPQSFSLSQNYPNPFNPTTKIKFDVPNTNIGKNIDVTIVVYDILGRKIQTLIDEALEPGSYEVIFDGSQLTSGIYYYKLITKEFTETKKMILIK